MMAMYVTMFDSRWSRQSDILITQEGIWTVLIRILALAKVTGTERFRYPGPPEPPGRAGNPPAKPISLRWICSGSKLEDISTIDPES